MLSTSIAVALWAFVSLVSALPMITNTNLDDIVQGKPFTLEFTGCEDGCNITLAAFNGTGEDRRIQNYGNWEVSPSSSEYTLTLNDLGAGDYWFYLKIGSHQNRYPAVSQSPTFHLAASNGGSSTESSSPSSSAAATNEPTSSILPSAQSTSRASAAATTTSAVPTATTIPNASGTLIRWTVLASAVNFGAFVILL